MYICLKVVFYQWVIITNTREKLKEKKLEEPVLFFEQNNHAKNYIKELGYFKQKMQTRKFFDYQLIILCACFVGICCFRNIYADFVQIVRISFSYNFLRVHTENSGHAGRWLQSIRMFLSKIFGIFLIVQCMLYYNCKEFCKLYWSKNLVVFSFLIF